MTVCIIGAGELGGAIAHALARGERVDRVRLIDDAGTIAAGKALDIQQAGAIDGFHTRLEGTRDLDAASPAARSASSPTSGPSAGGVAAARRGWR